MTREHAKKMLPFITAYAEGKPVQYRLAIPCVTSWMDAENLGFENLACEYRIKPEPEVRWIAEIRTIEGTEIRRSSGGRLTKEDAEEWGNRLWGSRFIRAVKFVEVPE